MSGYTLIEKTLEILKAKSELKQLYEYKHWYAGCRVNNDTEEPFLELLCKEGCTDRFTYISKINGIEVKVVHL
jgi:hypothetical protein